jgi:hypothetical protein
MTLYLSSGLKVQVPNSQYLVPFVDIARNGTRVSNNTLKELLINGVGDQPATLGRYFLTSAYLMVNHHANSFTLWQANPSNRSNVVRVLDEKTAATCSQTGIVVQPSATNKPQGTGDEVATGPPVGAIVGAVIGSVLG